MVRCGANQEPAERVRCLIFLMFLVGPRGAIVLCVRESTPPFFDVAVSLLNEPLQPLRVP
jgi:hypothetical protein